MECVAHSGGQEMAVGHRRRRAASLTAAGTAQGSRRLRTPYPRPAGSWFFPRSARAGQPQPDVGKAGTPLSRLERPFSGGSREILFSTVVVVDPNWTAWSMRVRRLAGRRCILQGAPSDGHPSVPLPIALAELGVRHIVHCPGSATSLNGEGDLDAF